ncbi:MAG: PEP-CTERM sorting domain-containing protein [Planctomycetaceae bacterium]
MNRFRFLLLGCGLVLGWTIAAPAGSIFTLLDSSIPIPQVLTRDGQAWAGNRTANGGPGGRYRNGMVTAIEYPPDAYVFEPTGISDDGSVVAGNIMLDDLVAYRWENGVLEPVLGAGDTFSVLGTGNPISANGSILVGRFGSQTVHPGYWAAGDRTFLPIPQGAVTGDPAAISADGSTIVGDILMPDGKSPAVWRHGELTLLPDLPDLSEETFVLGPRAMNVSSDGSVIVGLVHSESATYLARWTSNGLELLGSPISDYDPLSFDFTDDGSIVSFSTGISMIWREEVGSKPFDAYAARHFGLSIQDVLPNYFGLTVLEMTPDGRYFSGTVHDGNYNQTSFIAFLDPADYVVPEPSSLALAGCAAVGLLWAGRRSRSPRR